MQYFFKNSKKILCPNLNTINLKILNCSCTLVVGSQWLHILSPISRYNASGNNILSRFNILPRQRKWFCFFYFILKILIYSILVFRTSLSSPLKTVKTRVGCTVGPLYKNLEGTKAFGSYNESVLKLKLSYF